MKIELEATLQMYRSDFEAFAGFAFRELNGGKPMEMNWHIPLMADWLEKVRTSRIRRGIISMPPRNLKSLFASVFLPAFALGKAPAKQIILVAGNQRLAGELMDKLQRLVRSSRFREIFPHVKVPRQSGGIYTSQGGSIRTAFVGQQLSGAGADLIIIDDPLSPSHAKIKQKREGVNEWFDAEVLTRLNERASGALLLVMQRVHPEDLCAHIHSRQPSVEQLVIEAAAAEQVRGLFRRYLELRSVSLLAEELDWQHSQTCKADAFRPSRGQLYYLLANPLYRGKLRHKGELHQGEHEAIIDQATFDEVQGLLAQQAPRRRASQNAPDLHLLTGILYDEGGSRISPAHASNHGKRYRYYVSARLKGRKKADSDNARSEPTSEGWRLPAGELEATITNQLTRILDDRAQLATWIREHAAPERIAAGLDAAEQVRRKITNAHAPAEQRRIIQTLIPRVDLSAKSITLSLNYQALVEMLVSGEATSQDQKGMGEGADLAVATASMTRITLPIALQRRGQEARIVVEGEQTSRTRGDQTMIDQLARAHLFLAKLTDGTGHSISDVADQCGVHRSDVSRILPLAFLSPQITATILQGKQPADLTARKLGRMIDLPLAWNEQAEALSC